MIEIPTDRIPIRIWDPNMEEGALKQARNVALHPYSHKYVCVMPDGHQGFGIPIGGVAAFRNAIIPNAVGYDVGCGMQCARSDMILINKQTLIDILKEIKKVIPVGFCHNNDSNESWLPRIPNHTNSDQYKIVKDRWDSAAHEIGTLGGGNHFIEIQKGSDNYIYVTIHSGSRNVGQRTATYYNDLAKSSDLDVYIPKSWQLDPLVGKDLDIYLGEMQWCLDFAKANRSLMMIYVQTIMESKLGCSFEIITDIHHNYASLENFCGKDFWIHRKGATSAKHGELGIIPGSQGSPSYIVKGRGNEQSFNSCSHGAGRKMGREEAKRTLKFDEQLAILESQNILHSVRGQADLDEAPGSYKDIRTVMNLQKDLVEIITELNPIAVIKG
jgi:tRNA-splicing ligase RtcB (3'-phosphate/5'-hydroxy nucleic acid ligase)